MLNHVLVNFPKENHSTLSATIPCDLNESPLLQMPMFCTRRGSPHVLQIQQDPWHCEQFWSCYLCGCWKVPQGQIFRKSNFQVLQARNQQWPCLVSCGGWIVWWDIASFGLSLSLLLPFQLQILEWRKGKQNDASSGILNQAGATAPVPLWWGGHQAAASRGARSGRRHCFHCSCHTCDAEYQVCGGGWWGSELHNWCLPQGVQLCSVWWL